MTKPNDPPGGSNAPVHIVSYDPTWPANFAAEREAISGLIGRWIEGGIEHVGSTAVPGLAAKPVIDIMAGVRSLAESRPAIAPLATLGYLYFPYQPQVMHWFCKPSDAYRTHHLHLVVYQSPRWKAVIAFRDYLRSHPAVVQEYESLKRELAQQHRNDREAYTEAKTAFVARIVSLANSLS